MNIHRKTYIFLFGFSFFLTNPQFSAHYNAEDSSKLIQHALEQTALIHIQGFLNKSSQNDPIFSRKRYENRSILEKKTSKRGLFVSIFWKDSLELWGCMGSLVPSQKNLYDEVIYWTNQALFMDHRRRSKGTSLLKLKNRPVYIIITLIQKIEPVVSYLQINSIRYGMLLQAGQQSVLVLPGEAFTAAYAYKMLRHKLVLENLQNIQGKLFRIHAHRFGNGILAFQKKFGNFTAAHNKKKGLGG